MVGGKPFTLMNNSDLKTPRQVKAYVDKLLNNQTAKNQSKLLGILQEEDDFRAVVLGMAFIETTITELIEINIKHIPAFVEMRLGYWQKLNMCEALGLLNAGMVNVLKALGTVRNKFAHSTVYKLHKDTAYTSLMLHVKNCGIEMQILAMADSLDAKRLPQRTRPLLSLIQRNVRGAIFMLHAVCIVNVRTI
jgi:hypothetical protein